MRIGEWSAKALLAAKPRRPLRAHGERVWLGLRRTGRSRGETGVAAVATAVLTPTSALDSVVSTGGAGGPGTLALGSCPWFLVPRTASGLFKLGTGTKSNADSEVLKKF